MSRFSGKLLIITGLAVIGALFVGSVDDKLTRSVLCVTTRPKLMCCCRQVNVQLDRPHLVGQRSGEVEDAAGGKC